MFVLWTSGSMVSMTKKLKVITINTWHGGKLFDSLVKFIKAENPDIVLMQEVYNGKAKHLARNFKAFTELKTALPTLSHAVFSPAFLDIRSDGDIFQGNAVFSIFPLRLIDTVFFDVAFGTFSDEQATSWEYEPINMMHVEADIDGLTVDIFNIHGIWGEDGNDNPRRIEMSSAIVRQIRGRQHVILGGDFNVLPKTKTIAQIEAHLKNVFDEPLQSTFNMKHKTKPGYATSVVDMMFVSNNIKIVDKKCPDVDVSDHYPLVTTILV